MTWRNFAFGLLSALIAVLGLALPGAAAAAPTRDSAPPNLAGWWIAADDAFQGAFFADVAIPFEELLIVKPNGDVENRLMQFFGPDYKACLENKSHCSNASLVYRAKLRITSAALVFSEQKAGVDAKTLFPAVPRFATLLTVGFSSQWNYTLGKDRRHLQLMRGKVTRHFIRVDADRLRQLRAAFLAAEISASKHWRCFLSNATSQDPAFNILGGPRSAPPKWFEVYVTAAAVRYRTSTLLRVPTADDDKPNVAKLAAAPVEHFLLPPGKGAIPRTKTGKQPLIAKMHAIAKLNAGAPPQQVIEQARKLDPKFRTLPISSAGASAFKRLSALGKRGSDPEIDALFCNNGRKDPPKPRPRYDSFAPLRAK